MTFVTGIQTGREDDDIDLTDSKRDFGCEVYVGSKVEERECIWAEDFEEERVVRGM